MNVTGMEMSKDIVEYRLSRAYSTLEEADYNIFGGNYDLAINRLYYACYYAATAYFASAGIETKSHSGVKTHINKMVRDGIIERKEALTFNRLFDLRHESDYDDFIDFDKDTVDAYRPMVKEFIQDLENCILKENNN